MGPDKELDAFKLLPEGIVPEMKLIHYKNLHYNLVISKDCFLATGETGKFEQKQNKDTEKVTELEDEGESLESITAKYRNSIDVIQKLNKKNSKLIKRS